MRLAADKGYARASVVMALANKRNHKRVLQWLDMARNRNDPLIRAARVMVSGTNPTDAQVADLTAAADTGEPGVAANLGVWLMQLQARNPKLKQNTPKAKAYFLLAARSDCEEFALTGLGAMRELGLTGKAGEATSELMAVARRFAESGSDRVQKFYIYTCAQDPHRVCSDQDLTNYGGWLARRREIAPLEVSPMDSLALNLALSSRPAPRNVEQLQRQAAQWKPTPLPLGIDCLDWD